MIAHVEQAASAATIVAVAASEVTPVADGEFMIHDSYGSERFGGLSAHYDDRSALAIAQVSEARELLLDVSTKRTGASRETAT